MCHHHNFPLSLPHPSKLPISHFTVDTSFKDSPPPHKLTTVFLKSFLTFCSELQMCSYSHGRGLVCVCTLIILHIQFLHLCLEVDSALIMAVLGPSSNLSASSLLLLLITSEGVKWNTSIVRGLEDRKEDVLLQGGGGGGGVNHTVYSLGAENLLFCLLLFSISHMLTSIGPSLTSFLFLGLLHTHRTTHLDLRTVPYTSFNSWFFPYPILPALNVILTSSTYL